MKPKFDYNLVHIQNNTDAVDIDQKCIGLDCWIEGDSVNLLNSNRGLHVQIRHNSNKEVFEHSNKIARLFAAAPELLRTLETLFGVLDECPNDETSMILACEGATRAIARAKGE